MRATLLLLGFAAIAAVAIARPHHGGKHMSRHSRRAAQPPTPNKCASRCSGVASKFRYQPGKSYAYDYEATTTVSLPGAPGAASTAVRQSAKATISVISKCEMALKLQDVQLQGGSDSAAWKAALEAKPLRFSFDDGLIREICPEADEEAWALNVKRGVLSAFQNSLQGSGDSATVLESDVSGLCPTKYEVKEEGGATVHSRRKDLIACTGHHGNFSALRGVPYALSSKVQNTPLLDSDQRCTHTIKASVLDKAECSEQHSFSPLSGDSDEGILASTEQTLALKSTGKALACCTGAAPGPRKPLNFDHSEYEFEQSGEAAVAAKGNLRQLCQSSQDSVRPETPGHFAELVYNMRKMALGDLKNLAKEAKSGKLCASEPAFFKDAVPMCGSEACIGLMKGMLKKGDISDSEKTAWLASLALVPRPTASMVETAVELVDTVPASGLLGLSSLVHGYCRQNPLCAEVPAVETFVEKLLAKLGNKCAAGGEEVTMALKGLGNVGHVRSAVPKILACALNAKASTGVRVAAVQALRRMPCSSELEAPLKELTSEVAETAELRITAFLGLVRCPRPATVAALVSMLEDEPVNQVSSFVYSYLRAKQRSGSPMSTEIKRQLRKHSLHRRFARDPLRFSNFYEMGTLMEKWNFGGHIEEAFIFEPSSSLPRQAFANLTVHLFGSSVNLLEVGGRFEGMDKALGELWGPSGYLSNPDAYYFQDDQSSSAGPLSNRVQRFQDLWGQRRPQADKVSVSTYVRVFGDELAAWTYEDPSVVDSVKNLMDTEKAFAFLEKLAQLRMQKSVMFLDSVLTVPTVAGVPLRLAVNGTASINIEINTKADLKSIMRPPHSAQLMGHVKPSAAVELAAALSIDTKGIKSGARMLTTIHSATNVKGTIKLQDGSIFSTKVELPEPRMEIIDVHSQLFSLKQNVPKVEAGVQGPRSQGSKKCSPNAVNRIFGVKLCGEMQLPGKMARIPLLPLSGPVRTKLTLEKEDATLQSYDFSAQFASQPKRVAKLTFDTPGSTVDRELMAEVSLNPGQEIQAQIKYPGKEISMTGSLEQKGKASTGRLALKVDQKDEYSMEATLNSDDKTGYSLDGEVVRPGQQPVKVTGELSTALPRLALVGKVENLYSSPVEAKAIMTAKAGKEYEVEAGLKSPALNADAKYTATVKGKWSGSYEIASQARLSHKRPEDAQAHVATIGYDSKVVQKKGEYKMDTKFSSESNWYPTWESKAEYLLHSKADLVQNRVAGKLWGSEVEVNQVTRIAEGDKYTTELMLSSPRHRLDHKAVLVYQNRFPEKFQASAEIDTPQIKGVKASMEMERAPGKKLDVDMKAALEYSKTKISVSHSLQETAANKYKSEAEMSWGANQKASVVSDLTLKSGRRGSDYEMESVVNAVGKSYNVHTKWEQGQKDYVYQASLKQGGRSYYDVKLHLQQPGAKKTQLTAHLRSDAASVDFDVEGSVLAEKNHNTARMTLKKERKEFLKGEMIYPSKLRGQGDKTLKTAVQWGLGGAKEDERELSAEYKLSQPAAAQRTHHLVAKVDLHDGPAYDLNVRVHKSDHYALNVTANHGPEKRILDFSTGLVKVGSYAAPEELAWDMEWTSAEPLPARAYQLLLSHKQGPKGFAASGYLEDSKANHKISYDAEYKRPSNQKIQYKLSVGSKARKFALDTEMDFEDTYDFTSVKAGKTKLDAEWDSSKASYASDWKRQDGGFVYNTAITTPVDAMKTAKLTVEMDKTKARMETRWNKNKRVEAVLEGSSKPRSADLTARLATSFAGMESIEGRLKYAFKKDWSLDTSVAWGASEKVRVYHTAAGTKYELGFQTKVGDKDMEGKLASQWDQSNGKYQAEALYKDAPSVWKVDGQVDTAAETGRFSVETPTDALKSAAVSAKKTGDGEWLVESDRNGASNLLLRSVLKLKDGDHRVKLSVEKISKPFSVEYEGKYTEAKWRMKAELIRNPTKEAEKVTYALHLSDETKGPKDRLVDIRVRHPARQLQAKISQHSDWPNKVSTSVELTPNVADKRQPTKIHVVYEKKSETACEATMHVEDPTLPHGMKAQWRMEKSGDCAGQDSNCQIDSHVKVTYSDKPAEHLTMRTAISRGPADPVERSIAGRTSLVTPHEMSLSAEVSHPKSGLHAKLTDRLQYERCGEMICRQEMEAAVEFKDQQKETKEYSVMGAWDTYAPSASLRVVGPSMTWSLRGEAGQEEWRLTVSKDGDEVYNVVVRAQEGETLLFEVSGVRDGQTEVLLHASARLASKDLAQIRLWHTEQGKRIEDGEVTIRLDEADLLNTKLYLRPGLDREIQFAAQKASEQIAAGSAGNSVASAWRSVADSHREMSSSVYGAAEPLLTHWANQRNAFSEEFGPAIAGAMDVFQLYWEIIRELSLTAMDVVEQTIDGIVHTLPSDQAKQAYYQTKEAMADLPGTFSTLLRPFKEGAASLAQAMGDLADSARAVKDNVAEAINAQEIQKQLKELYEDAKQYPIIRQIIEWLLEMKEEVPKMGLSGVRDSVKAAYNNVEQSAADSASSAKAYLQKWEASLVEYELGRALVEWAKEAASAFRMTYGYISPEERIDDAFAWLRSQFHAQKGRLSWQAYVPRMVKNEPEEGRYEMEIPLPAKARSLEHILDTFHPDSFTALSNEVSDRLGQAANSIGALVGSVPAPENSQELREKFQDVLHTAQGYQATQLGKSWPFESKALLVGDQHFVTFDGRVFQFKAQCEYLLAHDFAEQRFSVHADFGKQGGEVVLKALKVRAQGHTVTLGRDGAIQVDGRPTELPWQKVDDLGSQVQLKVVRGEHAAKVEAADGLKVKCDWYYHSCSISLPGHYHGKSAGLLGSNDNEQSNDWTLPDGSVATDVDSFAQGWHVGGGNCGAAKSSAVTERAAEDEKCSEFFASRSSPFAACFRVVNPRPFQAMCEMGAKVRDSEVVACNVSSAYTQVCRWSGISLDMPSECIRCDAPLGQLTESQDQEVAAAEVPASSADVVFVVEEAPCNAKAKNFLAKLGKISSGSLGAKGVNDVRFGVVGFGGIGVHAGAHFHSGASSLNFDEAGLGAAAASLDFEEAELGATGEDAKAGAMAALKFTTDYYPFRPAVQKVVILVSCSACESGEVGFYELQTALLNNGVTLHMATAEAVESEEGRMEGVTGMDATGLFGRNGAAAEQGDREDVVGPHDSCTILAQETDGSVFQTQYWKALGKVVGAKASSEGECQVCECTSGCQAQASPLTKCYPCEVPQPMSLSGRATSFLNIPYLGLRKPSA